MTQEKHWAYALILAGFILQQPVNAMDGKEPEEDPHASKGKGEEKDPLEKLKTFRARDTSPLAGLPAEVHEHIGSYLDADTVDALREASAPKNEGTTDDWLKKKKLPEEPSSGRPDLFLRNSSIQNMIRGYQQGKATLLNQSVIDFIKKGGSVTHLKVSDSMADSFSKALNDKEFLKNLAPLKKLDLSVIGFRLGLEEMQDDHMKVLAEALPNLRSLDLSGLWEVTDEGIIAFIEKCPGLEELTFGGNKITSKTVWALMENCKNIRRLSLAKCADIEEETIRALAGAYPNLESLNLSKCPQITDETFKALAKAFPKLESLNLEGCWRITNDTLKAFAVVCPKLRTLNVENCNNLRDDALLAFGENCKGLQRVSLARCLEVTEAGLIAFIQRSPGLRVLSLQKTGNVTDKVIEALATSCKGLQDLDLTLQRDIGTKVLVNLATGCKNLRRLILLGCVNVTDGVLRALSENCRDLQYLYLSKCSKISIEAFVNFIKSYPKFQTLDVSGIFSTITSAAKESMKASFPSVKNLDF